MTDRYDEMSVQPDPLLAEELRQRLHAHMASLSPDEHNGRGPVDLDTVRLDADDRLVEREELYMPVDSPNSDSRGRWRMPAAVVAAAAVIGVAGIALTSNDTSSTVDEVPPSATATTVAPTTVPTTTARPTTAAPGTATGFFAGSEHIPVTFTVPDGWLSIGWSVIKSGADPTIGVGFFDIGQLYADPCQWVLVDPPIGPTVNDLVSAWADLPVFTATAPVDATIDRYAGKRFEITIPDYDEDECRNSQFGLWEEDGHTGGPTYWAQGPNQQIQQWVLDVNGRRLVIGTSYFPDTSPQDRAAIEEILASIRIG